MMASLVKQAAWSDIMIKAKRYKSEGRVNLLRNGVNYIVSEVRGDNGTYDTEIQRMDPNSLSITGWNCTCPWGQHAWGRTRRFKKFEGRPCAHVMATLWVSQSTPLDEESDIQRDLPPGIPSPGEAPGIPDVSAPPGEMVESQLTGVDNEGSTGTIKIPGTFSKVMRARLDSAISGER